MADVTNSFTAVGNGSQLGVRPNESYTYTVTGTFVGTWVVEYSHNGGQTWIQVDTGTSTQSETTSSNVSGNSYSVVRFRCSAYTSGTISTTLSDVTSEIQQEYLTKDGRPLFRVSEDGLILPQSLSALGNTEGAMYWDTDADQLTVGTGSTRKVISDLDGSQTLLNKSFDSVFFTNGNSAGQKIINFGIIGTEGTSIKCIEQTVDLTDAGATYVAMTTAIPSGAVILSIHANIATAVTAGGTTVKIALGLNGGDVDKYGITSDLTQNQKINTIPDWAVLSGDEQIDVCGVVTDGSALGDSNLSVGSVRVRCHYLQAEDLADA